MPVWVDFLNEQRRLQQYDPRVRLERITKPLEEYKKRRDQALVKLRAPPEQDLSHLYCWGGHGSFTFDDIPSGDVQLRTNKPEDKKKNTKDTDPKPGDGGKTDPTTTTDPTKLTTDKKPGTKILEWVEQVRTTKEVRIENPDDPSQYLMVERIEEIVFNPPGDDIAVWPKYPHRFKLKNPEPLPKNPPPRSEPARIVTPPPEP